MSKPSEEQLKEIGIDRDEYDKLVSDLREKGYECLGFAVHPDVYEKEIQRLESELDSLKKCYATTNESWCDMKNRLVETEQLLEIAKQDDLDQLQEIARLRRVIKTGNTNRKNAEEWAETLEKENAELRRKLALKDLDFKNLQDNFKEKYDQIYELRREVERLKEVIGGLDRFIEKAGDR